MANSTRIEKLQNLLSELGVRTLSGMPGDSLSGFPVSLNLELGGSIVLDLPNPGLLTSLDPDNLGAIILDPLGHPRTIWGLAKRIPFFREGVSVLDSALGSMLEGAYQGNQGALYLDGYRYFSARLGPDEGNDVFVLIVNANDEKQARRQASRSWRMANALKRLGKSLTMNQTLKSLCVSAAHEITSSAELAAVLLWTLEPGAPDLQLSASVGVNRLGTGALGRINASDGASCAAELVAATRQKFSQQSVLEHVLTTNLEAKFCYLKPGGVSVHPLEISGNLLGVLELVGKEGDVHFQENEELFETVAEHLALALNSAIMFENFERLAFRDALTGLPNHRSMQEFLHTKLGEAQRLGTSLGVIMIDVDHFRSFNEEEGHDAGDQVLQMVGEILKSNIRLQDDLAARYGGEEFTILMPSANRQSLVEVAERIRQTIERTPFVTKSGRVTQVTVSAGCALFPDGASDAPSLLKAADVELFEAKREGRNRVRFSEGKQAVKRSIAPINMGALKQWFHPLDWAEGEERANRLADEMDVLSNALRLSDSQRIILECLVRVGPAYLRALEHEDEAQVETLHAAPDLRLLIPSLSRLHLRPDSGPDGRMVPLLAKVTQVLLAMDKQEDILLDAGRFDPEIVALVTQTHRAA